MLVVLLIAEPTSQAAEPPAIPSRFTCLNIGMCSSPNLDFFSALPIPACHWHRQMFHA